MAGLEGQDKSKKEHSEAAGKVAVILAAGISISLILVTGALLAAAWMRFASGIGEGLSENGTQLLTGWGGGIVGVLGSYLGYTLGKKDAIKDFLPPEKPKSTEIK